MAAMRLRGTFTDGSLNIRGLKIYGGHEIDSSQFQEASNVAS